MIYFCGIIGFILGFYVGILMLKPAMKRFSNQDLRTNKTLAWKVGWIPWAVALIGMGLASYFYQELYLGFLEANAPEE